MLTNQSVIFKHIKILKIVHISKIYIVYYHGNLLII
jgi:hypothetical protein